MDYNDSFIIDCCDGGDKVVAMVPGVEVVPVSEVVLDSYIAFA